MAKMTGETEKETLMSWRSGKESVGFINWIRLGLSLSLMCIYRELLARLVRPPTHPVTHPSIYRPIHGIIGLPTDLHAPFLLFWQGSATGHISHTPTTTPFQYSHDRGSHHCRYQSTHGIDFIPFIVCWNCIVFAVSPISGGCFSNW